MIQCIIVNWNSGLQLKKCLESVSKWNKYLDINITVVDNNSIDGSDLILNDFQGVTLLRAGENYGFGKGCNLGAGLGLGEYILFLNPDAALLSNCLSKVIDFMENPANFNVGICGVQLLDDSGHVARSCAYFPTASTWVFHAIGLDRIFPGLGYPMAGWKHDSTKFVDHVIGAFFLVRRELFEEISGFDERFFVYLEDLDFSYRAHQAGWRSVYLADAQAFHAGGGTSNQVKARRLFYSLRSRLLYAFKHFSWAGAVMVMLTTLLVEPLSRSALAMAKRSWPSFKETWQGYGMLWRWLPQWWLRGITR
jgi:GT2 family glycosyltransferase